MVVLWYLIILEDETLFIVGIRATRGRSRSRRARVWRVGVDTTGRMKIQKHLRLLLVSD